VFLVILQEEKYCKLSLVKYEWLTLGES